MIQRPHNRVQAELTEDGRLTENTHDADEDLGFCDYGVPDSAESMDDSKLLTFEPKDKYNNNCLSYMRIN